MPNTAPLHLRSLSVDEESLSLVLEWLSTYAKLPTLDGLRTAIAPSQTDGLFAK
ncbi:hypothetical protein C8J57DRAFT_1518541 [Mycena rebaudengoi]|nr:hypothetical protein C8J57DRAFT_1518541 [Mycena rebaudengoi]